MSFVLNAHIKIGEYKFNAVHQVQVKRSVGSYVDTAEIEVPTTARLKKADSQTVSEATARKFNRGDKIEIQLGYNGELKTEFKGFVSYVDFSTPCKIECEGYSYQLKKKSINKSWKSAKLKDVLNEVISGTDIKLHKDVPDIPNINVEFGNVPALKVLEYLKNELYLSVYFVNWNELYVGPEQIPGNNTVVKYKFGWNVIDANSLRYKTKDDRRVKVVLKKSKKDGGKDVYTAGDADGDVKEIVVKIVPKEAMKTIADEYLSKVKFDGFEGSFNTFLQPYIEPTWAAEIEDGKYPERNGRYFVEAVDVTYGVSGARRQISISKKLSTGE